MSPIPADQQPPRRAHERRAVGQRYGKHSRTIKRWVDTNRFPAPDFCIGDRDYWYEETLDRHDRQSTIERAAAAKSGPARPTPVINKDQEPQTAP
jgi:hypothetical protein